MSQHEPDPTKQVLAAPISVPDHVVTRAFENELVALNLQSGEYHGLNPVAARMFETLREVPAAIEAVDPLVEQYGQPRDRIEGDLAQLVNDLSERGLVILGGDCD